MSAAGIVVGILIIVAVIGLIIVVFKASSPSLTLLRAHQASVENMQSDKHQANALVLSCMDYRFIGPTIDYLYGRNNNHDFDYFVLAGASLGYNWSKKGRDRAWSMAYEEHIRLAIKLHHITEIIVIDHMDCGYYKAVYGDEVNTPEKEKQQHIHNINKFVKILNRDPEFAFLRFTGVLVRPSLAGAKFEVIYEDVEKV